MSENSGLEQAGDSLLWIIEDHGNKDLLYLVSWNGELLREFQIKGADNEDWEDLASDADGTLYIGDIGNNDNDRKNLVIYRILKPDPYYKGKFEAEMIRFSYPEQKIFPPKKEGMIYDAEALFFADGSLYILTKNRSRPFNGETLLYRVPSFPGTYKAELITRIKTCEDSQVCRITAADISPDGKLIAALGYGKLCLISEFSLQDPSHLVTRCIDLGIRSQLESLVFVNDSTLLLSDEKRGTTGRNLYSYQIKRD